MDDFVFATETPGICQNGLRLLLWVFSPFSFFFFFFFFYCVSTFMLGSEHFLKIPLRKLFSLNRERTWKVLVI